ncbi:MAG TPA: sodium ion-translocating decarboxylase subunit beta, partial [Thermoanaerobacterales bacterium]|nr:sodium ion-translocating decarboxylase subunit beta [Thermoanaerobacterales bacterium]
MITLGCILLYLAIVKKYEPLLLIPIGFGILLANIPVAGLMNAPIYELTDKGYKLKQIGGLLYYLYEGNKLGIFPPIIFMGIG